jgi:hypothetical protein
MMMIGRGNKYRVNLLPNLVVHFSVISKNLSFLRIPPLLLQVRLHFCMLGFIGIDNCHNVVTGLLNDPLQVRHSTTTTSDLDAV